MPIVPIRHVHLVEDVPHAGDAAGAIDGNLADIKGRHASAQGDRALVNYDGYVG
jgi:hypothetical protein